MNETLIKSYAEKGRRAVINSDEKGSDLKKKVQEEMDVIADVSVDVLIGVLTGLNLGFTLSKRVQEYSPDDGGLYFDSDNDEARKLANWAMGETVNKLQREMGAVIYAYAITIDDRWKAEQRD